MTGKERERYHQLHPAKLLVDWSSAILAGTLLWRRLWLPALLVGFIPSIAVTAIFLSGRCDGVIERIRQRPRSRALALHLSGGINTIRFGGLALSWSACWLREPFWIPVGVLVVAGGWWLAWRLGTAQRADTTYR